jgi:Fe-S-cluster containining protein
VATTADADSEREPEEPPRPDPSDGAGGSDVSEPAGLPAGAFGPWLHQTVAAIAGAGEADVPCGGCTGCCTSSQFVPIGPDETDALAHIPRSLVVPAPGAAPGTVVLGYDQDGRCPMLGDHGCTIYQQRPRACRTYDCRVFAATATDITADESKRAIAERVRQWQFSFPTEADAVAHASVRRAADHLREHAGELPSDVAPRNATELAVDAIVVHDEYRSASTMPSPATVAVALRRTRQPPAAPPTNE